MLTGISPSQLYNVLRTYGRELSGSNLTDGKGRVEEAAGDANILSALGINDKPDLGKNAVSGVQSKQENGGNSQDHNRGTQETIVSGYDILGRLTISKETRQKLVDFFQ